jgi:hypothetical protein
MTLPGFNADTSLHRTNIDYRSRWTGVQLAGAMPQLVDAPGTFCEPCNRFGWQICYNCFIEPGRRFSWTQRCSPVFR